VTEVAHPPGLWPIPGDGVLARQGDLILLVQHGGLTDRMLDLLADVACTSGDGRQFADQVTKALDTDADAAGDGADAEGQGGAPAPAVVAFGLAGRGLAAAVYGAA
jgi:hypothetical protein